MDLSIYQTLCAESKIIWTKHCLERMQERDISRADVKNGITTGEIIENYPDDYPNPSCLIFGYTIDKGADNFCWFLCPDKEKAYAFLMRMPSSILL